METFGTIKSKILKKLTESYISKNKSDIKEIINVMKSDENFKNLYLFYEEIENKYIDDPETAKLYVDEISKILNGNNKTIKKVCNVLSEKLNDVIVEENKLYDALDQLLDIDSLRNVETKVKSKKKIIEIITTEKKVKLTETTKFTENETLLFSILSNNFNAYFDEVLNEEEKNELKEMISLTEEDVNIKMKELKENLLLKIESILNEGNNESLIEKLNEVKKDVINSENSKYNLYKLKNLLTDLQ